MRFIEILQRCKGHLVVINNNEERTVLEVDEDFIVLRGGNPQMQLTEFIPVSHITRIIRADYATGDSSISIDTVMAGGDMKRGAADGTF